MTTRSAEDILRAAIAVGGIARSSQAAVQAVRETAQTDLGIPARALKSSRVFIVNCVVDDSGSIDEGGLVGPLLDAVREMKEELQQAVDEGDAQECEVLVTLVLLNRGTIQPYCRVQDCIDLTGANYKSEGGTPLFGRSFELLGAMTRKVAELQAAGRTAQTFTVWIGDGKPTDWDTTGPAGVHEMVTSLTETKQHIMCGVDIGGEASRAYRAMGIADKWIIDPAKDEYAFRAAMKQVSRVSRSASKSAAAFRKAAEGGIGGFN